MWETQIEFPAAKFGLTQPAKSIWECISKCDYFVEVCFSQNREIKAFLPRHTSLLLGVQASTTSVEVSMLIYHMTQLPHFWEYI